MMRMRMLMLLLLNFVAHLVAARIAALVLEAHAGAAGLRAIAFAL